jgi:threonine dehydratase
MRVPFLISAMVKSPAIDPSREDIITVVDSTGIANQGTQITRMVEGSAALSVGGLLKRKDRFKGKKVVAVICGRNIDLEVFKRIIA